MRARSASLVALLIAWAVVQSSSAAAQKDPATQAWASMREPGIVVLMRHANAPGGGDPASFKLGDCSTQRNLDDVGRAQARRTGEALRQKRVVFDRVLTSQWCRCEETARLVMGHAVEPLPALNSFFGKPERGPAQLSALRTYLAGLEPAARILLVTHHVVIAGATGVAPQSGELVIARRTPDGKLEPVGRLRVD